MNILSWAEIDAAVHLLAGRLRNGTFDMVVGISRSGLIPAVMLSHRLGVRGFGVLDIPRTVSDDREAAKVPPFLRDTLNLDSCDGHRLLLVDDIVGSGETMRMARGWLEARGHVVTTATVVVNQANLKGHDMAEVTDHAGVVVHGWVHFPWEKPDGAGPA